MPRISTIFACAVVLGLAMEASARADVETSIDKNGTSIFEFKDADTLVNTSSFGEGMTIGGTHRPVRTILVRPRVHFVPELLKSIEDL